MTKLHLLRETVVGQNEYPDTLKLMRSCIALGLSVTPAEISAFQTERDILIHVEDSIEPTDGGLPNGSVVFWVDLSAPSQLRIKVKDASGVVKTGSIILT